MVCIFLGGPVWFPVGSPVGFWVPWDELRVRGVSKRTSYDFFDILVCKCVSATPHARLEQTTFECFSVVVFLFFSV